MFKIFIHNKPFFLADNITPEIADYKTVPETVFMDHLKAFNLNTVVQQMEKDSVPAGVFYHTETTELLDLLKSHAAVVQAAGGLVFTPSHEMLLIFRRGKWDLPKGKLDAGENLETCAVREIEEETGVTHTKIIVPLPVTYHIYQEKGKHILKESHWYLMKCPSALPLKPQTEEDIERCEWVPASRVSEYTSNMHTSLIDVINQGFKEIKKSD